jgi:diadenosine tetraphosphatase ApaH/serine/threonine PP2A family protein phosphatase
MRYAIISDVHGNVESLERALSLVAADDEILALGDIVGYGPNPNECIALLRQRVKHAVLGNHDLAALENFGVEYFNDAARAAIAWTQTVLSEESRAWLNGLSYEIRYPEFLMVHGAPVNYFEYILDKRTAAKAFALTDAPLVFIGHTHIAEYWVQEPDGSVGHRHMQHGGTLKFEDGRRYIVDVGSIGQPRDLNPEASFVFYDPQQRTVEWVRYPYPISDVQEKIHHAHLPEYLAMRLESGR